MKRFFSLLALTLVCVCSWAVETVMPQDGKIYYIKNVNIVPQELYLYNNKGTLKADQQTRVEDSYAYLWRCIANGDNLQFQNLQNKQYLGYRGFSDTGYDFQVGTDQDLVTLYDVATSKYVAIKKDGANISSGAAIYNTETWSSLFAFEEWEGTYVEQTEWDLGIDWYTFRLGPSGYYISNPGDGTCIELTRVITELGDEDLWMREGDDATGYLIYNKLAGPLKVLAAPTEMKGTTGAESYPILVDKNAIPEGYTALWGFAESSDLTLEDDQKAYYMYEMGYESNKVNNRNNKLAFWTGGADAGSTVYFTWSQVEFPVSMNNGSFTSLSGNWAKTWTSNTTPQFTLDAGYNNMSVVNSADDLIQAYAGMYRPQAYTLSAGSEYSIGGYSFDFVMSVSTSITVTDALGNAYASSAEPQHIEVSGLTEPTASFVLDGSNNGINITNMRVKVCARQREPEKQVEVFPTLTTGDIPYRIPAIATAYDGSIVAVADYRYSRTDIGSGRIDLYIRRSHDNGETWDDIQKPAVMRGDGNTAVGHQEAGFGDPCIVGDSESPRMMIVSCAGTPGFFSGTRTHHQGWARWYSDDNGATWSKPTYIDEEFIYSRFDNSAYGPVRGWFVGSGRICQSRHTKVGEYYRLYCAGSTYNGAQTANWVLYSDNFGESWEFLGGCDVSPIPGGDEPKVEELPDGSILLSSRCSGGRNFNIYSFTDTPSAQGQWAGVCFSGSGNKGVTALGNACNGEVMLVPVVRNADQQKMFLLLQSVPFGSGRTNVGIYYKELDRLSKYLTPDSIAANWTGRHQSSYLGSAYSTMTWQQNNTLGFLYEEETHCGTGGGGYTIIYKNYSVEQLTDSAYTYCAEVSGDSLTALGMQERMDAVQSGTCVGQYTDEALAAIQSAYGEYVQNPTRSGYEAFNSALATAPRVEMEAGRYYRLRNYGRGNQDYYLTATGGSSNVLGVSKTDQGDKQLFLFALLSDGSWRILCKGCEIYPYLGNTPATETRMTLVEQAEAGTYLVNSNTDGLSSLRCTAPTNASYPYLHLAGDNTRIVCWAASSPASNAASFWYIEPTDEIETSVDIERADPVDAPLYDLQGRRVASRPQHGIYIHNGAKIMVK